MITGVSKVVVPVDDQECAKRFRTKRIGFELRSDKSYGDERPARALRQVEAVRGFGRNPVRAWSVD